MKLLEGKVALVTGASRGIGRAIASRFAEQGAQLAFTYRSSEEKALALEKELAALGGKARAYKSDAGSFDQAKELIADIVKEFGQLDVVVNNAGITRDNLILRMSEEHWDEVMETNLKSMFNVVKNAAMPMLKARKGSIINLSSIVGCKGQAGQSNYAASKAGINGFTKSVADELGSRGIRCNAIAPGFIATDMTDELNEEQRERILAQVPMGRLGDPGEVADAALWLASDMSSYVSGQIISVCGAMNR